MDAIEAAKLKPAQLALLFSLALPLAAVPTLYIFLVDPALFDKLETSKLLLLAFSMSSPVFGIFYAVALASLKIDQSKKNGEKTGDTVLSALHLACMVTPLIYVLFALDLWVNSPAPFDPVRKALITPVAYGFAAGYIILTIIVVRAGKKKANQSPEPTAMSVTPPAAQEPRQP